MIQSLESLEATMYKLFALEKQIKLLLEKGNNIISSIPGCSGIVDVSSEPSHLGSSLLKCGLMVWVWKQNT